MTSVKNTWSKEHEGISVLDCTIRDGGLVNDHLFGDNFVRAVYNCCVAAGVDYMEIGYKNAPEFFSPEKCGPWRFCREEDIRRIVGDNKTNLKLSCMIDAGKSNIFRDLLPKKDSVVDVARIAFYAHQTDEAMDMIADAYEKGYDVWANMMAVTDLSDRVIDDALEAMVGTKSSTITIVDSFGSLVPEQTEYLTKKYVNAARATGKTVAIHAHNNQQLAFANSIESIKAGAAKVDVTIGGLGRAAGNCPMELFLGFLNNPKYKLRPVYQCLEEQFIPLAQQIEWGPFPEYIITGQFNQHPRAGIAARESEMRNKFSAFYDSLAGGDGK
ncbi:MAG: aldolase catalytic domain-containing protein [Thermoguttaceae bacterium]|nr:aldolase catalytic domain-containing protein [Thermoguttaceae bacterium]MBR2585848.1 aldolase catalytic domain-containing protein [Thermoguttaceae bacterium]